MSDPIYIPGQRWSSDGESELGLGVVVSCDGRMVRVLFPAAAEERTYAVRSAPLTRVRFDVGDAIRDHEGRPLTVDGVEEQGGVVTYRCHDENGGAETLAESGLDDRLRLNRPEARLLAARFDGDTWFTLRYEAWLRAAEAARSPLFGLAGARVAPIPHQLYIAEQAAGRLWPRLLLADEVGLGKTIEAGLILHRLVLAGRARRVLVVVPEPLLHQWLVEMLRRFNLPFALFDRARFDAAGEPAEENNPFFEAQRVLCSLEFLTSNPAVARAALGGQWEMLVVDEAHHLHWTPEESSLEYDLIEALAQLTPGALLLTATPEQLGRAGHFARLRLLDPHRFHDYDAFLAEEREYEPVAAVAARLLEGAPLGDEERALLASLLGEEADGEPEVVMERLLDLHGTGRVLYRNTRAAIQGFPGREGIAYPLSLPDGYDPASPAPERGFGPGWSAVDPRVDWLAETLRGLRPAKVLVICAEAATAVELREALHRRHGHHAALFHEGMEIVERDRAAAYFADPQEGSQALLCSEIGSEGRNFQFAHHLVLFDLPLEPELLEQRIGRLDRIGQCSAIRIHVPCFAGSAGEVLYRWYDEGLGAFGGVAPAAGAVFEALGAELLAALGDPARCDGLVARAAALSAKLAGELEAGRDRLLELHSHRPEQADRLVRAMAAVDGDRRLADFMGRLWDAFGVEHDPGPGRSTVLHPGNHMHHHHFPGLPEEGITVTFERDDALAHEDREFLTWEHPMVRGAMELLTGSDQGATAITVVKSSRIEPGTLLLELVYVAECPAPPELEIGRFLPPTALRLLLDGRGRDLTEQLPHHALQGESQRRNRDLAKAVVQSQTPRLRQLLERGALLAQRAADREAARAKEEAARTFDAELARLRALGAPAREERETLEATREAVASQLDHTRLRLDAARLIITR
ncbi:RNA polymerase-associated protein RapA [Endothiovibrio diazotrophicus]